MVDTLKSGLNVWLEWFILKWCPLPLGVNRDCKRGSSLGVDGVGYTNPPAANTSLPLVFLTGAIQMVPLRGIVTAVSLSTFHQSPDSTVSTLQPFNFTPLI